MPIYIAISLRADSKILDNAVLERIEKPNRHKLQSERGWLIQFDGTTVELSNHLKITGQKQGEPSLVGSALVAPITGYFGRGPSDMWEWLKIKFEQ